MGGATSTPRKKSSRGCWKFQKHYSIEDESGGVVPPKEKSPKVKRPMKLLKFRVDSTASSTQCPIPTPSVLEHHWSSEDQTPLPPTQEKLMQIISCFPFPTPRQTPTAIEQPKVVEEPPPTLSQIVGEENFDKNSYSNAFGKLVQPMKLMSGHDGAADSTRIKELADILMRVSVETMAITALPMDVWLRERLKKWVQLSGHEGSIVPASCQTLYKKQPTGSCEAKAYEAIMRDPILEGLTPKYLREILKNDECFIEIEDLLQQFADPTKVSIMDIKVGCRTFLESEVTNTKKRADLYQKMVTIDPTEPTPEENETGEITKLRYMQFRERESSSAQLGFRIEAAKMPGGCLQKNFKKVRSCSDVTKALIDFFGTDRSRVRNQLLKRLQHIRTSIERSDFFQHHEVVGSSLLIVHDGEKVGCWMIDFAKSHRVSEGGMTHRGEWVVGNHEDGYLTGVDNLIEILEEMPPMGSYSDEIPR